MRRCLFPDSAELSRGSQNIRKSRVRLHQVAIQSSHSQEALQISKPKISNWAYIRHPCGVLTHHSQVKLTVQKSRSIFISFKIIIAFQTELPIDFRYNTYVIIISGCQSNSNAKFERFMALFTIQNCQIDQFRSRTLVLRRYSLLIYVLYQMANDNFRSSLNRRHH